ncbi:3-coathanger stack domain-containing protein [Emticicia sp. C21]|uniref:immunoglobulin domain-containing protein n=1 Tax=Emticicia sp. C21 TaxID=2302915 RepID=UPI000E353597|nr:3-coathanger stack domain-containing protein [Emticicia sp. C21]RFS17823.1 hypothetical protein D0T08_00820 [Emticicia sp. C21]
MWQTVKVVVNPSPTPLVGTYALCKDGVVPAGEGLSVTNIADSNILSGTLSSNSPVYRRGQGDNQTAYNPSTVGTGVYFGAHTFVAASSGTFDIHTHPSTLLSSPDSYDTYFTLYQGSFDPNSPATNFLVGDDDSYDAVFQYSSKITYNFTAGSTYVLVVSPYGNDVTGNYTVEASTNLFKNIGWYANSSGGNALATTNIFNPVGISGSGMPNTSTPGTYNFYLNTSQQNSCRAQTRFIINATSVGGNIAGSTSVCTPTNTGTLALSGHTGSIVRWESSTDNFVGNIVPIANTTTTLSFSNLAQTTKYRAVVKNGNCTQVYSALATITVVVTASAPTPVGNSRCGTGTVTLTATGCAGGTINWYAGVNGGISLATGTTYTTPVISNNTTYYVACTIGSCTSARAAVQAIIYVNPIMSGNQAAGDYRASQSITSTANVATGVNYFAAKSILLNPGFQAGASEVFLAKIEDCP